MPLTNLESSDARLARIEEKLDGLDKRLIERCATSAARLTTLEKSINKQGERLGRLEGESQHAKGGKAAILALLAGGGVVGGLLVKLLESFGKGTP